MVAKPYTQWYTCSVQQTHTHAYMNTHVHVFHYIGQDIWTIRIPSILPGQILPSEQITCDNAETNFCIYTGWYIHHDHVLLNDNHTAVLLLNYNYTYMHIIMQTLVVFQLCSSQVPSIILITCGAGCRWRSETFWSMAWKVNQINKLT